MVGSLLMRGMLAGMIAGVLAFAFLAVAGEPQVDVAIAFEAHMDAQKQSAREQADAAAGRPVVTEAPEPDLVGRPTQAGIGLFTGVLVYTTAFGGLFALAFALCYGRLGSLGPRGTAMLLGILGLVSIYGVPSLKFPASPPSVGDPETIGMRTALYFSVIALSFAGMIAATSLRGRLADSLGAWNATIVAGIAYGAAMIVVGLLVPSVNDVPEGFPAVTLWNFRLASAGAQLVMWTTLALAFGALADRKLTAPSRSGRRLAFSD